MVSIYAIEDINDNIYVGSTIQILEKRLRGHRSPSNTTSSKKLNLYNCIIYELEKCEEKDRREREKYWINKLDCVNTYKFNYDPHKSYLKNKEEHKRKCREYNKKHREEIRIKQSASFCENYDYLQKKSFIKKSTIV